MSPRSACVVTTTRTSRGGASIRPSTAARSAGDSASTSSRNSVSPSAAASRPGISSSSRAAGVAVKPTSPQGPPARRASARISRATTPLPVPCSPVMGTGSSYRRSAASSVARTPPDHAALAAPASGDPARFHDKKSPMDLAIRNARVRGQRELVDIAMEGARIAAVGPGLGGRGDELDAGGRPVAPGFVNLHLHADKSLLGEGMRPTAAGTLPEAIEITNDFKRRYDPEEVAHRAGRVLEAGVQSGTTFFRLFADVGTIGGLRAARGLLLSRERYRDLCRIQVVAFPQEGLL